MLQKYAVLMFSASRPDGFFCFNESVLVDTPVAESRWAQVFDGWVDESPSKHEEHDEPAEESGENDEGKYVVGTVDRDWHEYRPLIGWGSHKHHDVPNNSTSRNNLQSACCNNFLLSFIGHCSGLFYRS
jgi:hypothetical protein